MDQRHRLRHRREIEAVRKEGKAERHRLGVLVFRPNSLPHSRFCYSASKRTGNAVQRNRAKRLFREAIRLNEKRIAPGWDCVLITRAATTTASLEAVADAVLTLCNRARLLQPLSVDDSDSLRA